MPSSRKIAAIMFTDIVGYTTLMGSDEENALKILDLSRKIQRPLVNEHEGNWIKELGDGVLASFPTASDAVQAAIQIQQQASSIPDLDLRIGIDLGEVVFENQDVFGEVVNIASRIMNIATPGKICISGTVYDNVANKKQIVCNFIGEEKLKNVKDSVRIYTVAVDQDKKIPGIVKQKGPADHNNHLNSSPAKSVAVLPFVNMSNDPEQEYFSDGITEEILNSLAQVKDLHVAGRTSSFHFKGKNYDLRKIGQSLNVETVLEGSVRKQGNRLRITAQLINVSDGYHIWSEKYDRQLDDIFAIQDEIAMAITEKLKITLLEKEMEIIHTNPTNNQEAYDLYLRGRFYFNKRGAAIVKGMQYFKQALEKDPDFALAYVGMADAYCILSLYCVLPPNDAMPKAKYFAGKAFELHHTPAEAETALAFISIFYEWDWQKARSVFQKILLTNPDYAPAHYWYSYFLGFVEKNYKESLSHALLTAEVLEPLVPISHHVLSFMYFNAGEFDKGLKSSQMTIELEGSSYPGYRGLGLNYAGLKKYDEAIRSMQKAIELSQRQPLPLTELCWIYMLDNKPDEIKPVRDELGTRSHTEYVSSFLQGCVAYYSGDKKAALGLIDQAFENRDGSLVFMNCYAPAFFFRDDELFRPYLERLKFPR